jgi:hypothetical protein
MLNVWTTNARRALIPLVDKEGDRGDFRKLSIVSRGGFSLKLNRSDTENAEKFSTKLQRTLQDDN